MDYSALDRTLIPNKVLNVSAQEILDFLDEPKTLDQLADRFGPDMETAFWGLISDGEIKIDTVFQVSKNV